MFQELEELQFHPRGSHLITREDLMFAAPGFYRIKTKDRFIKRTNEMLHGNIQTIYGQRYESDRVHVAHVMLEEMSRDFIGYEGLNVTSRPDGYKIVDGWCRIDRLEIEAGIR